MALYRNKFKTGASYTPTNGQYLRWNNTNQEWEAQDGSGSTDTNAIHDNVADEIHLITEESSPAGADVLILESSGNSWNKRRVTVTNLQGTPGSHASSHEDTGGDEIDVTDLSGLLADAQTPVAHLLGSAYHTQDTLANLNTKISDATLYEWENDLSGSPYLHSGNVEDGADATAIHDDTVGEIHAISLKSTPLGVDELVIESSADSWAKRRIAISSLPAGADEKVGVSVNDTTPGYLINKITGGDGISVTEIGDGGDEDLDIDMNINELSEEVSPTSGDMFVVWDGVNHLKVDFDNMPGAGSNDPDAIHDDVANEITAITLKSNVHGDDEVILEDSEASYIKKSTTVTNLRIVANVGRQIYAHATAVATGTFLCGIVIPVELNLWELTNVQASYGSGQGSSGTTDVQVVRWRSGSAVDMLTTKITLGAEWTVSDEGVNTTNDDLATGDVIYFDVDSARTGATGLHVVLTFTKP